MDRSPEVIEEEIDELVQTGLAALEHPEIAGDAAVELRNLAILATARTS